MNLQPGKLHAAAKAELTGAALQIVDHYESAVSALPGSGVAWLHEMREAAAAAFAAGGLPSRRVEEWKYSDLRSVLSEAFPAASSHTKLSQAGLAAALGPLSALQAVRVVFVNGHYCAGLSDAIAGEDVEIMPLSEGFARMPAWAKEVFGKTNMQPGDVIGAINTMFMTDGALVRIKADKTAGRPIHIVQIYKGNTAQFAASRNLIVAGAGASGLLIESHHTIGTAKVQSSSVTEAVLADKARLTHVKILDEQNTSVHLGSWRVQLGARSDYHGIQFASGGAFSRNETYVRYNGEDARAHFSGAQLLRGRDHCDMTMIIDHAVPGCESREHVKAVLDGEARGVFQAKVIVRPDAQQTDGRQMAQALMLSDACEFDAKPELEIYADDVKCNHGATVGELDEDMLFYLRARGIAEKEAKALLIRAFIGEVLDKIEHETLRHALEEKAGAWLTA